ncbi:AAA family ATPase [Planctomycetaceae bacterium SH139]
MIDELRDYLHNQYLNGQTDLPGQANHQSLGQDQPTKPHQPSKPRSLDDPHPPNGSQEDCVQLHETHISWVLVTPEIALKIKKPLKNPFLDYRSLAQRLEACLAELSLNQRYASKLYQAVVAIRRTTEGLVVKPIFGLGATASSPPDLNDLPPGTIDVAVQMQAFPDGALLASQLAEQEVTPEQIDQFATHLADFHRRAEAVHAAANWGDADIVYEDQFDNIEYLTTCSQLPTSLQNDLERISRWQHQLDQSLREVFKQRREAGFVRACHGDLHLENVVLWDDELIPFDGIEFSERLRWIDIQSDASFTIMDLHAHGYHAIAHRFANSYFEATGDYQGLQVTRWYQIYRALVRAKVGAIRATQQHDSGVVAEERECWREVGHFLQVAAELSEPQKPMLAITFGLSGSGKTFGSQRYVDQQGFVRVRSDVERKRLFAGRNDTLLSPKTAERQQKESGGEPPADLYSPAATRQTYDRLAMIARLGIEQNVPMLVDATFLRRQDRDQFRRLAAELGVPFRLLAFTADPDTLRKRLRQRAERGDDASDADLQVLQQQLERIEPLTAEEQACVVSSGQALQ